MIYNTLSVRQRRLLSKTTGEPHHFEETQAQQNIQKHIKETMPEEYQKANVRMDQVLKKVWYIANATADERVRLQDLALIDQCNSHKMDLITNGSIVSESLKYVNSKAEKLKTSAFNAALEEEEEDLSNKCG
jgi:hypothetical protein